MPVCISKATQRYKDVLKEKRKAAPTGASDEVKRDIERENIALEKKKQKAVQELSVQDMRLIDRAFFADEEFLSRLNQEQIKNLIKNDNDTLSSDLKEKVRERQSHPIRAALTDDRKNPDGSINHSSRYNPAEARKAAKNAPVELLATLDADIISNPDILDTYTPQKLQALSEQPGMKGKEETLRAALKKYNSYADNAFHNMKELHRAEHANWERGGKKGKAPEAPRAPRRLTRLKELNQWLKGSGQFWYGGPGSQGGGNTAGPSSSQPNP